MGRFIEKIKPYRRICSRFEKLEQSLLQLSRFLLHRIHGLYRDLPPNPVTRYARCRLRLCLRGGPTP